MSRDLYLVHRGVQLSPDIQRDVEEQEQEVSQGEGRQKQRGVVTRVALASGIEYFKNNFPFYQKK